MKALELSPDTVKNANVVPSPHLKRKPSRTDVKKRGKGIDFAKLKDIVEFMDSCGSDAKGVGALVKKEFAETFENQQIPDLKRLRDRYER